MIQRTSSSTHFLYGPLSSFLNSFFCLNFSLSLSGRFNGSWPDGGVCESCAALGAAFGAGVLSCGAACAKTSGDKPKDKTRQRVEETLDIGCAILPVRHIKFKVR